MYSTSVALFIERSPLEVVETMVEIKSVSPVSGSVSLDMMSRVVADASSRTVSESLLAVGAELEQEIMTVPVAVFEVAPEASDIS